MIVQKKRPALTKWLTLLCLFMALMLTYSPPAQSKTLSSLVDATELSILLSRSEVLKFETPLTRISVADPAIADVIPIDPQQIIINGKARGTTTLLLWDKNGQMGEILLNVGANNNELSHLIKQMTPKQQIETLVTDDSVVFTGKADSSSQVERIIKAAKAFGYKDENIIDLMEANHYQVSLKVRITESSRDVVKNLQNTIGYYTPSISATKLGNALDITRLTGSNGQAFSNGIVPPLTGNTFNTLKKLPYGLLSSNVGGSTISVLPQFNKNLQLAFDYLETNGKLKTLAEPTLMVAHGQEASFLAGGEIPFVSGTDRNGGPILSFKEYGVRLRFKPKVATDGEMMMLEIEPEVSTLDRSNCITNNGTPVCGLLKRASKTFVELKNSETLFISGIISDEEQEFLQKIPYMGDLPIIGPLFRNKSSRKNQRELLIIITPTVIKKTS
jgi:pilus assembly protein CpaC